MHMDALIADRAELTDQSTLGAGQQPGVAQHVLHLGDRRGRRQSKSVRTSNMLQVYLKRNPGYGSCGAEVVLLEKFLRAGEFVLGCRCKRTRRIRVLSTRSKSSLDGTQGERCPRCYVVG